MNGLILFIGESFRLGNQGTRNRGSDESYNEQIKACNSHIHFIQSINKKFKLNSMSVFISTYNTKFNNDLLSIYNEYLTCYNIYENVIGLNNLFHNSINYLHDNLKNYDFIFYIRIDLYLKQQFIDIFDPTINKILFPTICFKPYHFVGSHPRVNDMCVFIPKKYYKYINNLYIYHNMWYDLISNTDLTYDDLDTIINTYHDSDSAKDYNPLYYIVNRDECNIFHSEGDIFNKFIFIP